MIQNIEPPAAPDAASHSNMVPTSSIHKLPPELVTAILDFLDVGNLRNAAAVSRIFYRSAWSAGLYLSGGVVCNPMGNCESESALLGDIVQHALVNGRRLRLAVVFIVFDAQPGPDVKRILSTISSALPVLVYLAVSAGPRLLPSLVTALRHPAPDLRELVIHVDGPSGPSPPATPFDLFCGAAPKLRHLDLRGFSPGPSPVPAFSRLVSLDLSYFNQFPSIKYAAQFPSVRFLHLSYHTDFGVPPPVPFDLAGLRLRKLAIRDAHDCALIPAVSRWISPSHIPVFEHVCGQLHGDDPIWQEDIGLVSVLLARDAEEDLGARVVIVPGHRRWRRTYNVRSYNPNAPCPIRALTRLQLGRCLTYLRTNNEHLIALLEANWPALDALREMRIDFTSDGPRAAMVWPPDWSHTMRRAPCAFGPDDVSTETFARESYRYLRCPALESLALCHFPSGALMRIESREVAFLGRALGQSRERAVLVLVGLEFKTPVAGTLLQQAFSSVRTGESCGANSPWARDGGLWNEEM